MQLGASCGTSSGGVVPKYISTALPPGQEPLPRTLPLLSPPQGPLFPIPLYPPDRPIDAARTIRHLFPERLDLVHLPPARPARRTPRLLLASPQRNTAMQDTLAIMMHPLETLVVRIARQLAKVRGLGRGALDGVQLDPFTAVVGFVGFVVLGRRVVDVVGEVVPVVAVGREVRLDEMFEDFHEDEGCLLDERLACRAF